MLEKIVGSVERAGKYFRDMWKYLKVAIAMDKDDAVLQTTNPNIPLNPNANVKNWFKIFGWGAAISLFFLLWILFKLVPHEPRKVASTKSHHGYNRNGERY